MSWPDIALSSAARANLLLPEIAEPVVLHSGQIWRTPYDDEYYLLQAISHISGKVEYSLMQINEWSAYPDHATFTIISVGGAEVLQPLEFWADLFRREHYILVDHIRLGLIKQPCFALPIAGRVKIQRLIQTLTGGAVDEEEIKRVYGGVACGRLSAEDSYSMLGFARMMNIWDLVDRIWKEGIPGDLCECGAWRGGATILMKKLLETYDFKQPRRVFVCDSFAGFKPITHAEDLKDDRSNELPKLSHVFSVSLEQVKENFRKFNVLDDSVIFVEGYFEDSLKADRTIGPLALLRCDADLYEPTYAALDALYPKVSPGGYVIFDDYSSVPSCRQAVHDYLAGQAARDYLVGHSKHIPFHRIDWTGVWFRKPWTR